MSEIQKSAISDTLTNPYSVGPTPEDIATYGKLLKSSESDPDAVGFKPRINAEITFGQIDTDTLGTFVNSDVEANGLNHKAMGKLGQQRYIAGILGLKISPTEVDTSSNVASFHAVIPSDQEVPPAPPLGPDRRHLDSDGNPLSPIRRDMIFSARFLAANRDHFSKAGAFEKLAHEVTSQAEQGQITVRNLGGDPFGAMSLTRQVARVLGYEVDAFTQQADGTFTMPVSGIRKGFDIKNTHFKSKGVVEPLDKFITPPATQ